MIDRQPLLACNLLEAHSAEGQTRKFLQKRQISPGDLDTYKQRVNLGATDIVRSLRYDQTPKALSYPSAAQITNKERRGELPRQHFFPKGLPDDRRVPMARTLRHMQRVGIAGGGRHDENADRIGYFRLNFHPEDDERHGSPVADRSRLVMRHLSKTYPEMPLEHFKDDLGDGRQSHHIEIPHDAIPPAIAHIKEWQELVRLASWLS